MRVSVMVVAAAFLALAAPASGQGIRTVGSGEGAIEITTQVRHTTTIVLPPGEAIADVVAGDAEYWSVESSANVAYVKPLEMDVESNVTLVAESGRVWALLVYESGDRDPDLVVYVEPAEVASDGERHVPAFLPGTELAVQLAEEEAAQAELAAVSASVRASVAEVWAEQEAERSEWRDEYPRRLRFPYGFDVSARREPFRVDAMWHDGRFTYLRSRAQETPALYELRGEPGDGEPALVSYRLFEDGLYVTDHVLGAGRLRIGEEQTDWWVGARRPEKGWSLRRKVAVGVIGSAALLFFMGGIP